VHPDVAALIRATLLSLFQQIIGEIMMLRAIIIASSLTAAEIARAQFNLPEIRIEPPRIELPKVDVPGAVLGGVVMGPAGAALGANGGNVPDIPQPPEILRRPLFPELDVPINPPVIFGPLGFTPDPRTVIPKRFVTPGSLDCSQYLGNATYVQLVDFIDENKNLLIYFVGVEDRQTCETKRTDIVRYFKTRRANIGFIGELTTQDLARCVCKKAYD
jgi:hypothetical protein